MAKGATSKAKLLERPLCGPDADESEALAEAAAELQALVPGLRNASGIAAAVIGCWITARMKRLTSGRLADLVVFDLQEAKLRGMIEAAMPQIGAAMADAGIPGDVPFFQLSKRDALNALMCACIGYREAAVAAGELPEIPFDDALPFGGDAPQLPF